MNGIQPIMSNSLMNVLLSGTNQINSLRLAQALEGKDLKAAGATASPSLLMNGVSEEDADFLKTYRTKLQEMESAAQTVEKGGDTSRFSAGAEDPTVARAKGRLASADDRYALSVEQLASGQVNRSAALASEQPLPAMSGALSIRTQRGAFDFRLSAAGAQTNREMLENFAKKINALETGVTASVEVKDGRAALALTDETGAGNAFEVSGSLAERLGLDQAAKEAQDAVYTVRKNGGEAERFTSSSNETQVDGRLSVTLQKAGDTVIKAGADASSGLADAVSEMVDRFNGALNFMNSNSDRGIGVLYQTKRMLMLPVSDRSLALAGISVNKNGTLTFDRDTFLHKMESSPSLTGGIVQRLAEGVQSDARMGLQESSGNLLSLPQSMQRLNQSQSSALNFMNMYNRSGVYNMMNYYSVGALMNLNV